MLSLGRMRAWVLALTSTGACQIDRIPGAWRRKKLEATGEIVGGVSADVLSGFAELVSTRSGLQAEVEGENESRQLEALC